MAITYNIYANDGLGGPVDYTTPIATTPALGWTPGPLPPSSDTTFAVRAFDTTLGLEEANTEARVRIILDATGRDVSARPNPPSALVARATAAGGCLASWSYSPTGQGGWPTAFSVYLTPGTVASYATPSATVAFVPGRLAYSSQLSGLADGATYAVAVRASNASGAEANTSVVATVVGDSTPPANVDALSATATFASQ